MRSSLLIALLLVAGSPAAASANVPRSGDLVITEIAANPALPEPAAEYVVVDNVSDSVLLLDGLLLTDAAGGARGVVPPDTSLDPGQRIVLQPPGGAAAYGCTPTPHRALLAGWAPLNNDGDSVALERADGGVLDRVAYPIGSFPADGRSRRVDLAFRTPSGNDLWSRWQLSPAAGTPCAVAAPRPGRVRFGASELVVGEKSGSVSLALRREGGSNGRLTVPVRTIDGSATAGRDYSGVSSSVSFAATQTSTSFTVPVMNDARDEATESFTVILGGAAASEPARAVVRITDDDPPAGPVLTPTLPGSPAPFPPPRPGGSGGGSAPPATSLAPGSPGSAAWPPAGGSLAAGPSPRAWLGVAGWQPILRRKRLLVAVGCDASCRLEAEGDVALGRGRYVALRTVRRRLPARTQVVVRLRVPSRRVRVLRRALRRRGWLRATVSAAPDGGSAVERRARVR